MQGAIFRKCRCLGALMAARRHHLLPPAGAAASAAASRVPEALLPCIWLARPPGSCLNDLARCVWRMIMMRSPSLLGVSCTSVQLPAAQRRLMLTPVNYSFGLHSPFPIDPEVIQSDR